MPRFKELRWRFDADHAEALLAWRCNDPVHAGTMNLLNEMDLAAYTDTRSHGLFGHEQP